MGLLWLVQVFSWAYFLAACYFIRLLVQRRVNFVCLGDSLNLDGVHINNWRLSKSQARGFRSGISGLFLWWWRSFLKDIFWLSVFHWVRKIRKRIPLNTLAFVLKGARGTVGLEKFIDLDLGGFPNERCGVDWVSGSGLHNAIRIDF